MSEESAKSWVEAEWADSLDEELEMEIDDNLIARDLQFISDKRHKSTIDRNTYFHELLRLQAELVKLQDWVQHTGEKIVVVFEAAMRQERAASSSASRSGSTRVSPVLLPFRRRQSARNRSGISSATCRICRRPAKLSCSTAPGTTGPASNA